MDDTPPAIPGASETRGIEQVPAELLVDVFAYFDAKELSGLLRVCRIWNTYILHSPALWTDLDLTVDFTRPPPPFPTVLGRSAQLPLSLVCRFEGDYEVHIICEGLRPQLHRVRDLALLSNGHENYKYLCDSFLPLPMPMLRSLDLSTGTSAPCGSIFDGMFEQPMPLPGMSTVTWTAIRIPAALMGSAPGTLRTINCGSQYIPDDYCPALSTVTSVRMNMGKYNRCALRRSFAVFPRMETLEVRNCCDADGVGSVPEGHPLRFARLVSREESAALSWADLVAGGYTRIQSLHLEHFHPSLAASVSADAEWTANSLALNINARSTAMFVSADGRNCGVSLHDARILLSLPTVTQNIVELTISLDSRSPPMPNLVLPRATILTILCSGGGTGNALDADVVRRCGRLTAPRLLLVQLAAREAGRHAELQPRPLAQFISEHIQTAEDELLTLSLDYPRISLAADTQGLDALSRVACNFETLVDLAL